MAETNSKVKVIDTCRVAPAAPVPDTAAPTTLPLTFFDLLWLRFPPVHRLFYYSLSPSESLLFFDAILPKLKLSLSVTLRRFLPLAGKIIWRRDSEKPAVIYEMGDAVSLAVAQSDDDFRRFSEPELCEATECHFLVPELENSDEEASLMAVQVTYFPNSGFCVGITTHHAAMDGKASTLFMKAWAYACRTGEPTSLPVDLSPFYDREMIGDPAGMEKLYLNALLNENGTNNRSLKYRRSEVPPNSIRGSFEISGENIEKLRASMAAREEGGERNPVHISTFALTCAYVWVCIAKAEQNPEAEFAFAVDCRSRLRPAVPPSYVGNCVIGRFVNARTEDFSGENGVAMAVNAIRKATETLSEENGVYEDVKAAISRVSKAGRRRRRLVAAAGSPRFEVYSIDFGWGNPRKVEMTSIDRTGAICFSENRNGDGGIQIGLVLSSTTMAAFASLFKHGLQAI